MNFFQKLIFALSLSVFSFSSSFAQDFTLNSQTDVDAFDNSLTSITGFLTIQTFGASDPIVDLSNLSNLTSVGGELTVSFNNGLLNLNGLHNITSIGGNLVIFFNAGVINFSELANLTTIGGYLMISNNSGLLNLSGLEGITSLGGQLEISSNNDLISLDALINFTAIAGNLVIRNNDALPDLSGLDNITSVGDILEVSLSNALTNLDALANITSVGSLAIRNNDSLTNIDGLSNLSFIGGGAVISNNNLLPTIDALLGITEIGGFLVIMDNNILTNLDGLSNLISIGEYLLIEDNDSLGNLGGLLSLTSIGGYFELADNDILPDLDGLANLASIGGYLNIEVNPVLTSCCAIQTLLSTAGAIVEYVEIINNPSECSSAEEIITAACQMEITINVPCVDAENGSIEVEMGASAILPLTYTWVRVEDGEMGSGNSDEPGFSIENLGAGTYNLTVTDALGTVFTQDDIVLIPIPGSVFEIIEISTTNSSNGINNGAITLTIAGGTPPYDITWTGASLGVQLDMLGPTFTIPTLAQGEYEIAVTDDAGNEQIVVITLLDETVPIFPCTQPLDMVILNDVSGSVDTLEYNESKQFFVDLLNATNIGTGVDDSRAAIIEWSRIDEQSVQIPMTGDITLLQDYVNYNRVFDGGTAPLAALSFGENYLASVARPNAERVLVLSTDAESGQVSPALIALADEYKAVGYHIVTIAFGEAYTDAYTRNILRLVASIDFVAPGAATYDELDQDLAEDIVTLYLCPIDPGSSAAAFFDRDGAITIIDVEAVGGCPNPSSVALTFTIEAFEELSIPAGTPVTFYYNDPALFGATSILTWEIPCAIPVGTTETYTVDLPVTGAANIFAILNDDGSQSTPVAFPITGIDELSYINNSSDTTICTESLPTLQVLKYTTTPTPICNNIVMYTVNICNITDLDASGVVITDDAPAGFMLLNTVVNDNGCAIDNETSFDIPAGCCVSITYTYDATNAANGDYNNQGVELSGPDNQIYLDFDGMTSPDEDVLIDGTVDCPSTVVSFTKIVNVGDICEDAFVVYTFTIDNELNIPLQALSFSDILPVPATWVFEPYNLNGLSISNANLSGNSATFIIDEVAANTVATFSIDASLGDWTVDGVLDNTASLGNVPDLDSGTLETLVSNMVTTNVAASPEIEITQTFDCNDNTIVLTAVLNGQVSTNWSWITTGDGTFDDENMASATYTLGAEDLDNGETTLSVTGNSNCGEINKTVITTLDMIEPVLVDIETCEGETIDYEGTTLSIDDTQDFTLQSSIGCDSIVTVTVVGLPISTENLTLETCEGETINYNGTTLSVGDTQDFMFQNSNGCDSIVSVMVTGVPTTSQDLTIETCDGETVEYNNTTLSVGDTQDFTFQNSIGCDSIVSVTVTGLTGNTETLSFEACGNETIEYDGTTLSGGSSQEFIFQSSNGCDSVVSVTVTALPNSSEELNFETCEGIPVVYDGVQLLIGEKQTFTFQNEYGCDSTIIVNVKGKESTGPNGVPNVFSPNDDGINDCFQPLFGDNLVFQEYKLQIFNRWGDLIFSTTDPLDCWKGKFKSRPVKNGVYVWFVEMSTSVCEGTSVFSGDVTVVR